MTKCPLSDNKVAGVSQQIQRGISWRLRINCLRYRNIIIPINWLQVVPVRVRYMLFHHLIHTLDC